MSSPTTPFSPWKKIEPLLREFSPRLKRAQIHQEETSAFRIEYYFCHSVMELAQILHHQTNASELGSQHHLLKILFKFLKFGEAGILEYSMSKTRADIYLEHEDKIIEVKTITHMAFHKIYQKLIGVLEAEANQVDILWVCYFYKLTAPSPIAPTCQYLLTFISIDLVAIDRETMKWELMQMIEESKTRVAEKLKLTPEIIIPLENLIKVEDLERELAEKAHQLTEEKQKNAEKDQALAVKNQQLTEEKQKNAEKDQALAEKDQQLTRLRAELQAFKNHSDQS